MSEATVSDFQIPPVNPVTLLPLKLHGDVVIPRDDFFDSFAGTHIDGVIGANFFVQFNIVFDFLLQRISFTLPDKITRGVLSQLGLGKAAPIPLTVKADGLPRVSVTLQEKTERADADLLVDTGTIYTMIPRRTAQHLHLQSDDTRLWATGINGPYKINRVRVETLQIGDQTLHNVPLYYPDNDTLAPGFTLGTDLLQRYKLLLSLSSKQMYLNPYLSEKTALETAR